MPQSFQEVLRLATAFSNLPTTPVGGGGGPNDTGVVFAQTSQPGYTNNDNPPGGMKPQNYQKGLSKKKNSKGVSGCFFASKMVLMMLLIGCVIAHW